MFKLVGNEVFEIAGYAKCEIIISASFGFSYEYSLLVNGKQLTKFKEKQTKIMKTWLFHSHGKDYRVILGTFNICLDYSIHQGLFRVSLTLSRHSPLRSRENCLQLLLTHLLVSLTMLLSILFLFLTEKDSLDVWVNGSRMDTRAEFVEDGTEIQFDLDERQTAGIRTVSSGNKKEGIIYSLFVDGQQIPESVD